MAEPGLHPDVEPFAFLLGTWRGEGSGDYPTIEPFRYGEEMRFEHVGDPFLLYAQRSWLLADDPMPLHFERGFLRPGAGPGEVELTLAHPLGLTEVAEGSIRGTRIDVAEGSIRGTRIDVVSTSVSSTSTGSPVTRLERRIEVDGDRLRYELRMATAEVLLTRHLLGELRRM